MISFVLFGLVASACAAPQFSFGRHEAPAFLPDYHMRTAPYSDPMFDTSRFWADISKELRELDDMLADFTRHFPSTISQEGIEGNEYRITIPLSGFEEKDIIVKAREGLLMIQATHNASTQRNYLDIRTLPNTVNVSGTWIFENSVLKIVFPLKEGASTTPETVTVVSTEFTTKAPFGDRDVEEIDNNSVKDSGENVNVDVGLNRGDEDRETELLTNVIPDKETIEATTYAVDVKDDVEFVPVRF